jgi:hypothetical protein
MLFIPGGASQVPQDVQDKLKAIDPRLALVPYQTRLTDSGAEAMRQELAWRWAVVMHWAENDPRWEMVQRGYDRNFAFDRLGDIPADISFDQVPSYLKQALRPTSTPRHIYGEILKWNQDQELRNGTAVMDFAEELIQTNAGTLFRDQGKTVEKVYQYNPAPKNRLSKGEAAG